VAAWVETIDRAVALAPDHLSCYQLTVEEGTPLARAVAAGQVAGLPDEARSADLFLAGSERLETLGFEHYEVSNFARPGRRSRHNDKYWRRVPYLGIGPSAHSFDGSRRWWNRDDLEAWIQAVQRDGHGQEDGELLGAGEARLEALALGLRTSDGVSWTVVGPGRERVVARLVAAGLLREAGDRIVPTRAGLLVADALARDL
jgi:oxygen-independent coproporphyrinogen-3 oxidase